MQYKFGRQIMHLLGYYNVLVGDEFSFIFKHSTRTNTLISSRPFHSVIAPMQNALIATAKAA